MNLTLIIWLVIIIYCIIEAYLSPITDEEDEY